MEFQEVLHARHSVRYFDGRPVPTDTLRAIVEDAQQAPSWVNAQEWRVWIATGERLEKVRREYARMTGEGIKGYADFTPAHRDQSGRTHKDASPVAYKSIFIYISTPIRIFMVE